MGQQMAPNRMPPPKLAPPQQQMAPTQQQMAPQQRMPGYPNAMASRALIAPMMTQQHNAPPQSGYESQQRSMTQQHNVPQQPGYESQQHSFHNNNGPPMDDLNS